MKRDISIKELLRTSWALYKESALLLIGFLLGFLVLSMVLQIPLIGESNPLSPINIIGSIFIFLYSIVGGAMLLQLNLKVINNEEPTFLELFPPLERIFKFLLLTTLLTLPWIALSAALTSLIGENPTPESIQQLSDQPTLLLIIGASALLLLYLNTFRLYFAPYLVIDQNLSPWAAICKSWKMSSNNQLNILKLVLFYFIAILIGLVALIVGIFAVLPYITLLFTLFYRRTLQSEAKPKE